jgi:4-carboxymuconolactone decarboxylase
MNSEQRTVYDEIKSGPRGTVPLVFLALLDAPELTHVVQAVGRHIRFESSLPDDVREVAILTAAAAVGSGYEWAQHFPIALSTGVSRSDCAAALRSDPEAMSLELRPVARFCLALVQRQSIDTASIEFLTSTYGRRGVTELTVIAGFYPLIANGLKVAGVDTPIPEAVE